MAKKDYKILLDEVLGSIDQIFEYTADISEGQFNADQKTRDAVMMHLIVIGEAVNRLPMDFRNKYESVEWMKIVRTRHIVAHEYGRVDSEIIWRIVTIYLPDTKQALMKLYSEL
jgi:uncharacterized protein with HEPN domain